MRRGDGRVRAGVGWDSDSGAIAAVLRREQCTGGRRVAGRLDAKSVAMCGDENHRRLRIFQ